MTPNEETAAEKFRRDKAVSLHEQIIKAADELLDGLASTEWNTIAIDGPVGKVQFFQHLKDYHKWDGKEWLTWNLQGGGEMVSEMHDAEHDGARQNDETDEMEQVSHTHPESW